MIGPGVWVQRKIPLRSVQSGVLAACVVFSGTVSSALGAPPSEVEARGLLPCVHEVEAEVFAGLTVVPLDLNREVAIDFILDTGANHSALNDPQIAAFLGVEQNVRGLVRGMGAGAALVGLTNEVGIFNHGLELMTIPLVVHDISDRIAAQAGRRLDGLLGWELFDHFVVEVDLSRGRILLHDPETFVYHGRGEVLPLSIEDRRPIVEAFVSIEGGKEIAVRLLVDSGSARYLSLINRSKRRLKPPAAQGQGRSIGVIGSTNVKIAQTGSLRLGGIVAHDVETAWMESVHIPATQHVDKLHGVLGNALLRRFRTIFDYRGGRLILEAPGFE